MIDNKNFQTGDLYPEGSFDPTKPEGVFYSFEVEKNGSSNYVTLNFYNNDRCTGDIIEAGEWRELDRDEIKEYANILKSLIDE